MLRPGRGDLTGPIREHSWVYLDMATNQVTYKGEVSRVSPQVMAALVALMDTIEQGSRPQILVYTVGDYSLNLQDGWLSDRSTPVVRFSKSCARIMAILMTTPGVPVANAKILRCIYAERDIPQSRVLAVFLRFIRKTLLAHNVELRIDTVWDFGLVLVCTRVP